MTSQPQAAGRRTIVVQASGTSNIGRQMDRAVGAAVYLLPFMNAFVFGRYLLAQYPSVSSAIDPLMPAVNWYNSVQLAPVVTFFAIYFGGLSDVRKPTGLSFWVAHCRSFWVAHRHLRFTLAIL